MLDTSKGMRGPEHAPLGKFATFVTFSGAIVNLVFIVGG